MEAHIALEHGRQYRTPGRTLKSNASISLGAFNSRTDFVRHEDGRDGHVLASTGLLSDLATM